MDRFGLAGSRYETALDNGINNIFKFIITINAKNSDFN